MNAAASYRNVQNETASKERLMVQLFETALMHIRKSAVLLEKRDMKSAVPSIARASDIVFMLASTLKPEVAPELCQQLGDLYKFITIRLTQGLATGDPLKLREAERAFAPIVDAFSQAVVIAAQKK